MRPPDPNGSRGFHRGPACSAAPTCEFRPCRLRDNDLDRIAKDGYSLLEPGWIRVGDRKFYFEVTAEKDGHRRITQAPDREQAVVHLGVLIGYPMDE